MSAATAARRWERIAQRGDAWISGYNTTRGTSGGALVEVDCDANDVRSVAAELATSPRTATIETTSGGRDLVLTVLTKSINELSDYLEEVNNVPGVRSIRSHVITILFTNAAQWRLNALEPGQESAIQQLAPPRPSGRPRPMDQLDQQLSVALSRDGRASASDLAHELSVSVNTVRRRLVHLTDSGVLDIRCDITRAVTGHELAATLWIRVPPPDLAHYARTIAHLPQIRLVASVTGPHNLLVMAWLRHAADLPTFESQLTEHTPTVHIEDRAVTLRTIKHVGRLLDDHGRARELVPVDIWTAIPRATHPLLQATD
ncbi:Lrp/AsnC ligand binding domain-containing protein [Rhodococcus sp. T2V]|nr:Lrp/AsnC ligand binding domain-containing protein [Rhodococcus sp. T2V]MDF3312844.1 Lrp/AsnC ligand binding domain-containing protein [Rhodococcus sp. T2V]